MKQNIFKSKVVEVAALRGWEMRSLGDRIGIANATLYNKMRSPESMTFEQFNQICSGLKMTREAKLEILGSLLNIDVKK